MTSNTLVIGHRGYPECYPENSLIGVMAAVDAGVGGVEIDVHLTREGVPVVIHDASVARTAGISDAQPLYQWSLAQLRQVSVHEPQRFGSQFAPCPVPTLKALCDTYAPSGKPLFIELKSDALQAFSAEQYVAAVLAASAAIPAHLRYLISFSETLVSTAAKQGGCQAGWVLETFNTASLNRAAQMGVKVVACDIKKVRIEQLRPQAWEWFVYDVVEPELAQRLRAHGVKYIESWNPPKALS